MVKNHGTSFSVLVVPYTCWVSAYKSCLIVQPALFSFWSSGVSFIHIAYHINFLYHNPKNNNWNLIELC